VTTLSQTRTRLRALRRAVPAVERSACARAVTRHVARSISLRAGARIALYAALPEELDTSPLLAWAHSRGHETYLPRIVDRRRCLMKFCRIDTVLAPGPHGIREPGGERCLAPRWLDAVFLPLVGFDVRGARLGMGRGYYDRALAFRHTRRVWRGPLLVGLAYGFQRVPHLDDRPHDVHLDAIVTERGLVRFERGLA